MLISISIKNWKSFKDKIIFSMEAGRERNHSDTVAVNKKLRLNILPVSAIFGSNASGKSNFVKAFSFLKTLIVDPSRGFCSSDPYAFRLDSETKNQPTEITTELLLNDLVYSYSISFNRLKILEERLSVLNTSSEKVLFERNEETIHIGDSLKKEIPAGSLMFATSFLSQNYPALNLLGAAKDISHVPDVFNWFKDSLRIITPDSISVARLETQPQVNDKDLSFLRTGVCGIKKVPYRGELPDDLKRIFSEIKPNSGLLVRDPKLGALSVTQTEGELNVEKLLTIHKTKQGDDEFFSFSEESDGLIRLFDLMPAIDDLQSSSSHATYIIDEIDRSLHTLLTSYLLSRFLEKCDKSSRKQLIFTTHDVQLINQSLLRRDELWICERTLDGSSQLYPMTNFKELRIDKDIQKSYLEGRMGGIPRLFACQTTNSSTKTV